MKPQKVLPLFIVIALVAGCSTHATSDARPSSTPIVPSTTARGNPTGLRVVAQWAMPAGGEPVALAAGSDAQWITEATGDGSPGRLLKISSATGGTLGSWPIGSQPAAVAVTEKNVWVVDAAAPKAAEPNLIIESMLSGTRVHTYSIDNPTSIAADSAGAWVGSASGDEAFLTHVQNGTIGEHIQLPGAAFAGAVPVAICDGLAYAVTADVGGAAMLVSSVSSDGVITSVGQLSERGTTQLACSPGGLLAEVAGNSLELYRLTAGSETPARRPITGQSGLIVGSGTYAWQLSAGDAGHTSAFTVEASTFTFSTPLDLLGQVVAADSDREGRLWMVVNMAAAAATRPVLTEVTTH